MQGIQSRGRQRNSRQTNLDQFYLKISTRVGFYDRACTPRERLVGPSRKLSRNSHEIESRKIVGGITKNLEMSNENPSLVCVATQQTSRRTLL